MKAKNKISGLTERENLKTENELLKTKLTAEFGMSDMKSDLPDDLENVWLNKELITEESEFMVNS